MSNTIELGLKRREYWWIGAETGTGATTEVGTQTLAEAALGVIELITTGKLKVYCSGEENCRSMILQAVV